MSQDSIDILLVEEDGEQADLIVDTAKVCRSSLRWGVAHDSTAALACLQRDCDRPDLVLLDIRLPQLAGLDVLRAIKSDPQLRGLPVIVMSGSRTPADVDAVYALGANCCISKPVSFEGLCSLVRFIEAFLALPKSSNDAAPSSVPGAPAHSLN